MGFRSPSRVRSRLSPDSPNMDTTRLVHLFCGHYRHYTSFPPYLSAYGPRACPQMQDNQAKGGGSNTEKISRTISSREPNRDSS